MATKKGNTVSVGGGKFQLRVLMSFTTSAIKFKPYIVVTDSFSKTQKCTVQWKLPSKKTKTYSKKIKSKGTYYIPNKNWQSNTDYSVTISAKIGGKTSSVTLTSTIVPAKPSIKVIRQNDNHFKLTIKGKKKGSAVPTNTVKIQRKAGVGNEEWEDLKTLSPRTTGSYSYDVHDQTTVRGNRYYWRAIAYNQAGNSGYVATKWQYTLPPDISDVVHERLNNNKCLISFKREVADVDRYLITGFKVESSESGGAWTEIADIGIGNLKDDTVHYTDKTCSMDNYYKYRIKPKNSAGTSKIEYPSEGGTEVTYNTPAAPLSVKAAYTAAGTVKLTMENKSKTANELQIQRTTDLETWVDVETIDQSDGLIETYEDITGIPGTQIKYRVRSGRKEMDISERYSAWKESNIASALKQPNKPTIIQPVNGTPITFDNESVRLAWVHNPNDGTEQSAATIRYRTQESDAWKEINVAGQSYYDMILSAGVFSPNDTIEWQVRTQGVYETASDYSDVSTFVIYAKPEVHFTAPNNGAEITNLPLELSWSYTDNSGALKQMSMDILLGDEVKTSIDIPVGEGLTGEYKYSLAGFLFENNTAYQLIVRALSSTGLSTTDTIGISINYVPVRLLNGFFTDMEIDEETGYATVTIAQDVSAAEEIEVDPDADEVIVVDSPVKTTYLYRVSNGKRVLIAENLSDGDQVIDKYCPLNIDFTYELFEVAESGQVSFIQVDANLESEYWFVYWGKDNIARAMWNPNGSVSLSRPEKTQIRYSGRTYPVTYDSVAIEETFGFSAIIFDRNELNAFRRMMEDGGQGIWKSCDGDVYAADFEFSYSADYTKNVLQWDCNLDVTRIESGDL